MKRRRTLRHLAERASSYAYPTFPAQRRIVGPLGSPPPIRIDLDQSEGEYEPMMVALDVGGPVPSQCRMDARLGDGRRKARSKALPAGRAGTAGRNPCWGPEAAASILAGMPARQLRVALAGIGWAPVVRAVTRGLTQLGVYAEGRPHGSADSSDGPDAFKVRIPRAEDLQFGGVDGDPFQGPDWR